MFDEIWGIKYTKQMLFDLVSTRPALEDAPSPSLSSSTQSRDKSEADTTRKSSNPNKLQNGKKGTFGFSMAMEVRPVRSSTSSRNLQENNQENFENIIKISDIK